MNRKVIQRILTNADTFPVNPVKNFHAISAINRDTTDLTITVGGLTIVVKQNETFDGDIISSQTINATGSVSFAIALLED